MDQGGTYKYFGVTVSDDIQYSAIKEKVRKVYCPKVRMILKSDPNAANRIRAINTLASPVINYSFNIINLKMSEIKTLDTKNMKALHHCMNAPSQS